MLMKEADNRAPQLSPNYKQKLEEITARATSLQTTCEYITRQRQQEAQATRDELDNFRAQYELGKTRIKALVAKHRQKFNNKIEEALGRVWQD